VESSNASTLGVATETPHRDAAPQIHISVSSSGNESTSGIASPAVAPVTGLARFLDVTYRRRPDATPAWFIRQAGRCLADYRTLRGGGAHP
jgi:hypothetical protein